MNSRLCSLMCQQLAGSDGNTPVPSYLRSKPTAKVWNMSVRGQGKYAGRLPFIVTYLQLPDGQGNGKTAPQGNPKCDQTIRPRVLQGCHRGKAQL